MKYTLKTKTANNPEHEISVELLTDFGLDYTDEICLTLQGLKDFETIETSLVLNKKDLNNLIGMLLQAQQTLRNKSNG